MPSRSNAMSRSRSWQASVDQAQALPAVQAGLLDTRQREEAEIERARQAQKVCEAEHGPAEHTYDRAKEDTP